MKRYLRGIIFVIALLFLFSVSTKSHAIKYFDANTKVKNKTTVELTWKKKNVDGYDIYRANSNDEEYNFGTFRKIATISGNKTKYVDKAVKSKRRYGYQIKAYKYVKGKKVYKYEANPDYSNLRASTYAWRGLWDEYLHADAETTPTSIELIGGYGEGIYPTGYEIYRKTSSASWKKIATVKAKGLGAAFTYVDKTVVKGKTYRYKFRPYKKVKGKKTYSKYSDVVKLTAINKDAIYSLGNYTQVNGNIKSIVLSLTSAEGNGKTVLEYDRDYLTYHYVTKSGKADFVELKIAAYSYDNINWIAFSENGVPLLENETVYIQLEEVDGKNIPFYASDAKDSDIEWWMEYNNKMAILRIDFLKGTAKASLNGEYYY